jgi:hypothetical protein
MAGNPQTSAKLWPGLTAFLAQDLAEEPEVSELPFPSSNPWILDQVALWLTLGQIPRVTHGFLSREHVIQGGEQAGHGQSEVVHHYFGMDKTAFLSEINRNFG